MQLRDFLVNLQNVKGGPVQFTARCPAHDDSHNSLSVAATDNGNILVKCHAGCATASVLDSLRLKPSDLFERAGNERRARVIRSVAPLRVLPKRDEVILHEAEHEDVAGSVVYPYEDESGNVLFEVVRIPLKDGGKTFRQRRRVGDGYVYKLGDVEPVLYRLPLVRRCIEQGDGIVVLCEGEKDADALIAIGLTATTAPMGAGKWRTQYTQHLYNARHVYIIPDNDKPGRAHALTAGRSLHEAGVPVSVVDLAAACPNLPRKGDVSDALAELGETSFKALLADAVSLEAFAEVSAQRDDEEARAPYVFDTAACYIKDGFLDDLCRQRGSDKLSTGFKALDEQLDGRLYPGLYVIGSVSSLGKTAFCLQMADHIAQQREDVLFFTLEMPRVELVARSLMREIMLMEKGRGDYNVGHVLYGRVEQTLMDAALAVYTEAIGRHIAFIEGGFDMDVESIADTARRHVRATGRRPVVFVDYLQILRPSDARMTDKQAVDFNVIALKRLSRELNIPVIAVSSFNRQNYSEEVNMSAFKESGAIEYSADFVMGLQARGISEKTDRLRVTDEKSAARTVLQETKSSKQKDPRPLEAVILKNRRGPAWARFGLDFYARGNLFVEVQ